MLLLFEQEFQIIYFTVIIGLDPIIYGIAVSNTVMKLNMSIHFSSKFPCFSLCSYFVILSKNKPLSACFLDKGNF